MKPCDKSRHTTGNFGRVSDNIQTLATLLGSVSKEVSGDGRNTFPASRMAVFRDAVVQTLVVTGASLYGLQPPAFLLLFPLFSKTVSCSKSLKSSFLPV